MADMQIVVFAIADEHYGVDVRQVKSIERVTGITQVPTTLTYVRGVVQLRNQVVPVVDMRERIGVAALEAEKTGEQRMIVVSIDERLVGLIVDSVQNVQNFGSEFVEQPPELVGGLQARYLAGVLRREEGLLILLNLEQILSDAEREQLALVERSIRG